MTSRTIATTPESPPVLVPRHTSRTKALQRVRRRTSRERGKGQRFYLDRGAPPGVQTPAQQRPHAVLAPVPLQWQSGTVPGAARRSSRQQLPARNRRAVRRDLTGRDTIAHAKRVLQHSLNPARPSGPRI